MRRWIACALGLYSAAALAATEGDRRDCASDRNIDARIAACTRVIEDSAQTPAFRTLAYRNRGIAYGNRPRHVGPGPPGAARAHPAARGAARAAWATCCVAGSRGCAWRSSSTARSRIRACASRSARDTLRRVVGIPVQVLRLARRDAAAGAQPRSRACLLSTDQAPRSLVAAVEAAWGCRVFDHYGTTEMGLGGGVECEALDGYHLREADLLFEVVDPETGAPVPDGEYGEVVFTTLTREAMPLIRYRTGDRGRFLVGPCPCGTPLRRLERVRARLLRPRAPAAAAARVDQAAVDEALFALPPVLDVRAALRREGGLDVLDVEVLAPGAGATLLRAGRRRLEAAPALRPRWRQAAARRRRRRLGAVAAGRRHGQADTCRIEDDTGGNDVKEILDEVLALLDGGEDFALVKLIGDRGSTPRAAGAEMLVRRDGSIAGTIGGGLLELTMMREAAGVLESARAASSTCASPARTWPATRRWSAAARPRCSSPTCRPATPQLREVLTAVRAARAARRRAWLFTLLPLEEGGTSRPASSRRTAPWSARSRASPRRCARPSARSPCTARRDCADGRAVVVEQVEVPATAVICGGGHVARAVAPAALAAGFAVTVLDDREEFADPRRFPGAKVVLGPFDGALERLGVDAASYVVIVTRGHTHDMDVLVQALRTPGAVHRPHGEPQQARAYGRGAPRGRARRGRARARALAHRPGHRRGDAGGAGGQHRRRDDPGARRQDGLTHERPVGDRPGRRLLVAHGRAQAARRPARPHAAGAGRRRSSRRSASSDVVVVTGHRGDEVAAAAEALGARPVPNPRFDDGMYTSVQAGAAAVGEGRRFFLLPVDCPLVRPETVGRLARAGAAAGADVALPVLRRRAGHPPLLGPALRAEILAGEPAGGLRELLAGRPRAAAPRRRGRPASLHDADVPGDLERLRGAGGDRGSALGAPLPTSCSSTTASHRDRIAHSGPSPPSPPRSTAALNERGQCLCVPLVVAAALLHDVARAEPRHGDAGAGAARAPRLRARRPLVRRHMRLGDAAGDDLDETQVVYLADKLVQDDRIVGVDARFAVRLARYAGDPSRPAGRARAPGGGTPRPGARRGRPRTAARGLRRPSRRAGRAQCDASCSTRALALRASRGDRYSLPRIARRNGTRGRSWVTQAPTGHRRTIPRAAVIAPSTAAASGRCPPGPASGG